MSRVPSEPQSGPGLDVEPAILRGQGQLRGVPKEEAQERMVWLATALLDKALKQTKENFA